MREPQGHTLTRELLELFNSPRKLSKEFPQSSSLPSNPKLYAAAKENAVAGREVMGKEDMGSIKLQVPMPLSNIHHNPHSKHVSGEEMSHQRKPR